MKIAAASLNQTPLDWKNNRSNIIDTIQAAIEDSVDLLCLPELCITGYGCEDMFLHPWVAEKSLEQLALIMQHAKGITVTLGLPYSLEGKIYNTVAIVKDGNLLGFQAKQHLPKDGIHYEPRWFEPWTGGKVVHETWNDKQFIFGDSTYLISGKKIGFEICEDAWVIDRPACRLVKEGIDIILNPSASHFALNKSKIREKKVVDASKEFNCTYVFANQLGNEAGRVIYDGDAIIAHKGDLAASTSLFSFRNYEIVTTTIDDNHLVQKNINATHQSKNRQFNTAISLGLFDYLRKSRSQGFVLSLSGGADSSTCLVLISEMVKQAISALGIEEFALKSNLNFKANSTPEDVVNKLLTTAYQATEHSSTKTLESAKELAISVGAKFFQWSIHNSFNNSKEIIESAIGRELTWKEDDITLQNIQARSRSPLIWMLANINNSLLITTSNRSEGAVGYTTMDGDTSGSLAPIAGIDKPFIIQWLQWAEKELGYKALGFVNNLTPSAELRPLDQDQSDEKDLMPYVILNKIETLFSIEKQSPMGIFNKIKMEYPEKDAATYVVRFFSLWSRNQWKRERIAPSFHLDDRNLDPRSWFRFPILSGGFQDELNELELKFKK